MLLYDKCFNSVQYFHHFFVGDVVFRQYTFEDKLNAFLLG